ncbi:MAG: spermidine synthase [Acidimicrobiales bacterium]|nr:spermidine synthase [Acidimicrobiales bacterium]
MQDGSALDGSGRMVVAVVFFLTGAAALLTQITWQRVIALHAGVDLESSVTVVAAFLGGLGLGTLAGGRLADRLRPPQALLALGASNALVAAFSTVSIWLLYDVYRDLAGGLEWAGARLAFNGVILLVPTFLQGLSLPLVARAVSTDVTAAGSQIGRFNAANTVGAAVGAFVGGWVLLGHFGFAEVARIAALAQGTAAVVFVGLALAPARRMSRGSIAVGGMVVAGLAVGAAVTARRLVEVEPVPDVLAVPVVVASVAGAYLVGLVAFVLPARSGTPGLEAVEESHDQPAAAPVATDGAGAVPGTPWVWYIAYGVTGAVALGFEQVFFRLVDGVMRSNSYTFPHVLSLYLALLGIGGVLGSQLRTRLGDDRRAFLWLQFGVGLSAATALVLFSRVLPTHLLADRFDVWFNTDGFAGGFADVTRADKVLFGLALPLLLMGVPVLLMGAAFPFVQGLVTTDLASVGRRTGGLVFANLVGSVTGTVVTGLVLIDRWGTAGTYRLLVMPLAGAGVAAAWLARSRPRRIVQSLAATAVLALVASAIPSNDRLWATLQGTTTDAIVVAEDRSCASALELYDGGRSQLTINGAGQNGYPFDDFHVLIGLLPSLSLPDPDRALAIGLGIGSTSYSMLASERTDEVTSVELCGGNYELVRHLARKGVAEFEVLVDDPRHRPITGDGRRHLLVTDHRYDLVVPDTVRPNSAGSGNLYSREFQALVSSRLTDDGITAGWVPTYRSLNAVSATFPYVVVVTVDSYNESSLYLAGRSPIDLDPAVLVERFDALPEAAFAPEQRATLRSFLADLEPVCVNDGQVATVTDGSLENRDLHPRDEYFVVNGGIGEEQVARTCGA